MYSRSAQSLPKSTIPTWISSSGVVPGMISGPPAEGVNKKVLVCLCLCARDDNDDDEERERERERERWDDKKKKRLAMIMIKNTTGNRIQRPTGQILPIHSPESPMHGPTPAGSRVHNTASPNGNPGVPIRSGLISLHMSVSIYVAASVA